MSEYFPRPESSSYPACTPLPSYSQTSVSPYATPAVSTRRFCAPEPPTWNFTQSASPAAWIERACICPLGITRASARRLSGS